MFLIFKLIFLLLPCFSYQEEESEEFFGKLIGKFNIHHHGVGGEVYAVNDTTFYIKGFNYDGQGKDAYFWAGVTNQPGSQGFIVPDRYGRTNVLKKHDNVDFTITLPENKLIPQIRWLAIYDLYRYQSFGDVYIPEGFDPPHVSEMQMNIRSDDISCDKVHVKNMKTVVLERLSIVSDNKELYFWIGKGHVPSIRGTKIPDDLGYLDPLRDYFNEDIELTLPGDYTFTTIDWLAVFDLKTNMSLGYVIFPADLNVPPNLQKVVKYEMTVPKCEQLHANMRVGWEVVGQTITFELVGLIDDNDWMGFGVSGSDNTTKMIGSDVAIAYLGKNGMPNAFDYKIDARAPCTKVVGHYQGVCKDSVQGGSDALQVLEGRRVGPLSVIKFRRQLTKSDEFDKEYQLSSPVPVIWAMGKLMDNGEPGFHRQWSKTLKKLQLDRTGEDESNCLDFLIPEEKIKPWDPIELRDRHLRNFTARIGPSGGERGYEGMRKTGSPGYSWYIQGFMTPIMYMQRGITYTFVVEGGNNPHRIDHYHPFIITSEPVGGHQPKNQVVLAGIEVTRRGQAQPTAAGTLCIWEHKMGFDRHTDSTIPAFEKYRNKLSLICPKDRESSVLDVTPNSSWPDVVYYHSYSQPNMGSKIYVVDNLYGLDYSHHSADVDTSSSGFRVTNSLTILSISFVLAIFPCVR